MHKITTFYFFKDMSDAEVEALKSDLFEACQERGIYGLVILANEGINSTLAGSFEALESFKSWINEYFQTELFFKNSQSERRVFRRLVIKRRDEIVTTTSPDLTHDNTANHHLSPAEWNRVLKEEDDVFLVDTRNWYETKIGTFKGAKDPDIEKFTEFPDYIDHQNLPKDKKILMFCTGGIRCEKGILELQKKGYDNVFQLEGGILNYLEQFPNDLFEGECFVFDQRVAVDQDLNPSVQYTLCPHTGQPAEVDITCVRCGTEAKISTEIAEMNDVRSQTCSKNCAYHWELNPGRKGEKQEFTFERAPMVKDKKTHATV